MNRLLVTTVNSTPHGQLLVETINHLVAARAGFARLQSAIGMMTYGVPADYAQMATELGMVASVNPTKTPEQNAADLASLLAAAAPAMEAAILDELVARCDQGG